MIYGALGVEERARARIQNNEEDLRLTFAVLPLANHFVSSLFFERRVLVLIECFVVAYVG